MRPGPWSQVSYGKTVGSIGDASAFSFYFSKNLSALGEGGIVLSNDEKVTEEVKKLRMHGQTGRYTHQCLGYNARLDELQAVVLRLKLRKLEGWNRKRQELASLYTTLLEGTPLTLPQNLPGRESVFTSTSEDPGETSWPTTRKRWESESVPLPDPLPPSTRPGQPRLQRGSLPVCERVAKEIHASHVPPHEGRGSALYGRGDPKLLRPLRRGRCSGKTLKKGRADPGSALRPFSLYEVCTFRGGNPLNSTEL